MSARQPTDMPRFAIHERDRTHDRHGCCRCNGEHCCCECPTQEAPDSHVMSQEPDSDGLVHVDLPEDDLDWGRAFQMLGRWHPGVRLGQLSRTVAYPNCSGWCRDAEGNKTCRHAAVMRYSARALSRVESQEPDSDERVATYTAPLFVRGSQVGRILVTVHADGVMQYQTLLHPSTAWDLPIELIKEDS